MCDHVLDHLAATRAHFRHVRGCNASRLDQPDVATVRYCFHGMRDLRLSPEGPLSTGPQAIESGLRRWRLGMSLKRWLTTILVCAAAVSVVGICLRVVIVEMVNWSNTSLFGLGFGQINDDMMMGAGLPEEGTQGLTASILFVNLPHVILSFVYLLYNALLTCMHLAYEYSGYEVDRKPFRVTTPYGHQRKTYWLQLPFKYAIPLVVTSATLHWLISQAVFLVRAETNVDGKIDEDTANISAVGISPAPMVVVLIIGSCFTLLAFGLGFMKLRGSSMPVAASCSFALAAAAHRPKDDVDAAVLPVKWGEVVQERNADVGHCCFTSQEVVAVKDGKKYA